MFNNNDKLTLSLVNAKDIHGKIIPFSLNLPLNCEEYNLPERIASIDVFESHQGLINGGVIAFSIYVGETTTIKNLIPDIQTKKVQIIKNLDISSLENNICFQIISGKKIVFAKLNEQDIIVQNQEQLKMIIGELSNEYAILCDSVTKIRALSNKNNN